MKLIKSIILLFAMFTISFCNAQKSTLADSTIVNKLIDSSKSFIGTDTSKVISLAKEAIKLAKKINYPKGEAYAFKNIGLVYYLQARYLETLDYWNQSLEIFEKIKDNVGRSNILNNIAGVYFNQGADVKALELSLKSLQLAEQVGDTLRILSALNTIGSIYYNKKDPIAIDYLLRALPLSERLGNTAAYIVISGNIGEIYYDNNENDKALKFYQKALKEAKNNVSAIFAYNGIGKIYLRESEYEKAFQNHQKALDISEKFDDKLQIIRSLKGFGAVYVAEKKNSIAIGYYSRAKKIAEETNSLVELKDIYQTMASIYSVNKDYTNAFQYQSLYSTIKDSLYSIDSKKKLNQLQFDFDIAKKESQIELLTKDTAIQELDIKRQKIFKNALLGGVLLLIIIATIIYRNYRNKVKINEVLDEQKVQIETLLHNILPDEIATELKAEGRAKPRFYESVSVLFTDFKGFSTFADKLTPQELVEELNNYFIAFDDIVDKYNLEKIKTIGDSYMCAGGIPTINEDHTINMVKAGLEMQEYIKKVNINRNANGLASWHLRIGIHVGPLVAGVVGRKKYAYDIWGTTVNTASRMESNGEEGLVNISESVYEIIKNDYNCIYRGKISAKNIGEVDMYFVSNSI